MVDAPSRDNPSPGGVSRDNPGEEDPASTLRDREKGGNSLARSCNPGESTCTIQGCILEVNPDYLKYWDPKKENGEPKRGEKGEFVNASNSVSRPTGVAQGDTETP